MNILKRAEQEEAMLERIVAPGDKVELCSTEVVVLPDGTQGTRKYQTTVYDVLEDGKIEIVMPMEKTKLILLPVEGEYEVFFFTSAGLYHGIVRIVDREKRDLTYILTTELITTLNKFQRREYYRFNCVLEMQAKEISEMEVHAVEQELGSLVTTSDMKKCVIVDISGGGLRFVSKENYLPGQMLYLKFQLPIGRELRSFDLAAKVIMSRDVEKHPGKIETRAKFIGINNTAREDIIKYIFNEERKNRKNGKR